jgi:hypothetical protein
MGAYTAPTITAAGLTIPSYQAVFNYLIGQYQSIYGANVNLDNSNADIQFISIIALAIVDVLNAVQLDYNNRSPVYAIGAALDTLVALNGLTRKQASFSTCQVILSGAPSTVVNNGVLEDVNGNLWNLPSTVTIGGGGTVTTTATAQVPGAIDAQIGQISGIVGGVTSGWTSVTNAVASVDGQPVETDSQLRTRQAAVDHFDCWNVRRRCSRSRGHAA